MLPEPSTALTLGKILTKPAIQAATPLFKKFSDSVSHWYNDGFLDYFAKSLKKYKEIKTLLHRQPTNFYDIYYPAKLQHKNDIYNTDDISGLFNISNNITIIGDAGSGKSTLIRHLFISSLCQKFKAPIFIALRDLNEENSNLENFIRSNILKNKLAPSDDFLNSLLEDGDFIFFLDGYDEIKSSLKHDVTQKIENFIDKYQKNFFVLTSRPYSNIEFFKDFVNYQICDLSKKDIDAFIKQQIKESILAKRIVESLKENQHEYINTFLKNPLLLTLYIMSYSKNSSIPSNKYVFYRRVFDVLFTEHDTATKIGFEREIKTKLNQEQLENILQIFSFLTFFDTHFDFDKQYIFSKLNIIKEKNKSITFSNNDFLDDMKLAIGLWIEDSGIYSFSHRSMQEYFTAVYITNLEKIENKISIYKKIISLHTLDNIDLNNFLSLCYEMDKIFFIKHYLIPVLLKIKSMFVNVDGNFKYDMSYLSEGFISSDKYQNEGISVTDELRFILETFRISKIHYEDNVFTIVNLLLQSHENPIFKEYIGKERGMDETTFRFTPPDSTKISDEYINFLRKIGIDNVMKDVIINLDNDLDVANKILKDASTQEDDLINMI